MVTFPVTPTFPVTVKFPLTVVFENISTIQMQLGRRSMLEFETVVDIVLP